MRVNSSPTNAVASVVYSSLARTLSTASRRIERWSKASRRPVRSGSTGVPVGVGGIGAGPGQHLLGQHGDVGDAHHPAARVAVGGAVRPQLLEHDVAQAGLLAELALGRGQHVLPRADEAARQREATTMRLASRA